jgi:hypothetical protein
MRWKTSKPFVGVLTVATLFSLTACGPSAQDVRGSTFQACWDLQYAIVSFNAWLERKEEVFATYKRQDEKHSTSNAEALTQEFTDSNLELIYSQGSEREILTGSSEEFKTSLAEYLTQVKDEETVFNSNLQRVLDECLAVGLDVETESSDTDSFRFRND